MDENKVGALTRLLDEQGRCQGCGTERYTRRELNLHDDQRWLCYSCLDRVRYGLGPTHQEPLK